jgi:hypothetical protein
MKLVSGCCLKNITVKQVAEFPWGDNALGFFGEIDVCDGCGNEIDHWLETHECCGLEICECEVQSA